MLKNNLLMISKLFKFPTTSLDNVILFVNEVFTKSFSFILFWFLGIKLLKVELSEFLIEMPFIFIFSSVLSFGISTFLLDNKKNKDDFKIQAAVSLGIVFIANLIILTVVCTCFFFELY